MLNRKRLYHEVNSRFLKKRLPITRWSFHLWTLNLQSLHLYKMSKSWNGTKISDKNWFSVKSKCLENKKWLKNTVKSTGIMNVYWLSRFMLLRTNQWIGKYIWILDIFSFPGGLTPTWQHDVGCWFLCYPRLAKLYYRLISLDHDSKVGQGFKEKRFQKQCKFWPFLLIFKILFFLSRKWKTWHLAFN